MTAARSPELEQFLDELRAVAEEIVARTPADTREGCEDRCGAFLATLSGKLEGRGYTTQATALFRVLQPDYKAEA